MDRLEKVREIVNEILDRSADRSSGYAHLYGVSATAALLALQRGQDPELASIAGLLHDLSTYETGSSSGHGEAGARRAREILTGLATFSAPDVDAVCDAVARHSEKAAVHDAFCELLKDADVLHHFLTDPDASPIDSHAARRAALRLELRL